MKKRVVFFVVMFLMLVCVIGIASAAVSIYGYEYNDFQIGLSTQRPNGGGFYSRGVQFQYAINDNPTDNMYSTIVWSVSPTDGGPALTITAEGAGRMSTRAWLNLDPAVSYTAGGPYTYQISMDINGIITSKNITVNFVNNSLPTSYGLTVTPVELTSTSATLGTTVNMTNSEMYMVSGKTYAVTAVIGGTALSYSTNERMWSPTEWNELGIWSDSRLMNLNLDGSNTGVYTAQQTGIYDNHYYVVSFYGNNFSNLGCYIPYTLYITDESGNAPGPQLLNAPADATWYMGLPWGGPGQSGIYSMSAIGQLWFPDDQRDMSDLNITWDLKHERGPDNFELYHVPDSNNPETYFFAMAQPKSGQQLTTGDSEYTMTATYKGITYKGKMTLHTVNTGMPTGVTFRVFETSGGDIGTEVPITNGTLTVESGKKYLISGLFTGGTAAPNNQWINNQYNDQGVTRGNRWNWGARTAYGIYSSNTEMFTADAPGTYSCEADLSIGLTNLGWCMPFTMVVTNPSTGDPYFMEPMISIKSEYEADEEVLISFPWVSGAEYHEIRIFNMDGTDAYSWSNVHWEQKDIQGGNCCFQVNVDAGPGQNRLMDPGNYYTIITLRGTGYRETTFRRDFTILSTSGGGHGGQNTDTNWLENGNSTWTWYLGLSGEWPQGDGVGSDTGIIQFRIPQQDWIGADAGLPIWTITNNHSSAADDYEFSYVTEEWNNGRGISLQPTWNTSDETVTGTNTYRIQATYNGKTFESTETIRFVRDSYPTGMTMTVNEADLSTNTIGAAVPFTDGGFTLEEGKDYVFTSSYTGTVPTTDMSFYMNGSLAGALEEYGRYSAQFETANGYVWSDNQQVFAAMTPGTYQFDPSLSIGMSNLVACKSYTIRIAGSAGGKMILPRGLKTIENEAFLNTAADEIDIPDSVTEIGENAFPSGVTLIVGAGTDAETWARENGYMPVVREAGPVGE